MAWKNLQQTTLVDSMLIVHEALKELDDVHELINWSRIESLLAGLHSSPRGEKAWPPLMMFKALLLQSWYALSDPALEKQLARDLLFRRCLGRNRTRVELMCVAHNIKRGLSQLVKSIFNCLKNRKTPLNHPHHKVTQARLVGLPEF